MSKTTDLIPPAHREEARQLGLEINEEGFIHVDELEGVIDYRAAGGPLFQSVNFGPEEEFTLKDDDTIEAAIGKARQIFQMGVLIHSIYSATNLDELARAITDLRAELDGQEKTEELVDLHDLPTFGGEAPASTESVWSWDRDRLLVGEGEFEIVSRAEWAGFTEGAEVEGGAEGTDDYDTGKITKADGADVTVAWSNGERTMHHYSLLRLI